jgi:hypothetical protein
MQCTSIDNSWICMREWTNIVGYRNTQGTQQGVKYGTLHICRPIVGDSKSTDSVSVAQGVNDKLYLARACGEASGTIGILGTISLSHSSPHGIIKGAWPPHGAFPRLARGAHGTLRQDGEPRGPQHGARSIDVVDVTVHSQQGHRNHALTWVDPGHSTTTTSIPPEQRGWRQMCHLNPSLWKSRRTCQPPSWHRDVQVKAWPWHVTPANGEAKRSTPRMTPRYRETVPTG